ncbi:TIGR02594 family protein [Roseibium sp. MMSF_3544]|uniref:TIGR02594 family protein n=1 Tax=unclassified Roseibium TaxID=2629323 RepID=UPI00273EF152|nr:TIGR02594 family protein [Roseibium sp. MMSF_3544]
MGTYFKSTTSTFRFLNKDDAQPVEEFQPDLIFREIVESDSDQERTHVELYSLGSFVQPSWLKTDDLELLENYTPKFAFDLGEFVRSCVSEHWRFNNSDVADPFYTNMDFLIALAFIQSKLDPEAEEGQASERKGIFGLTEAEWEAFRATDFGKDYQREDHKNPYAQIACAAYQMHAEAKALSKLWQEDATVGTDDNPYVPRFGELLRCRLFGVDNTFAMQKELKAGNHGKPLDDFLAEQGMDSASIAALLDDRKEFMRTGQGAASPAESLHGFKNKVETKLDNSFKEALKLIKEHSPDTVTDNTGSASWMPIAEGELGTSESDADGQARITEYFGATGTNGTHTTPWCGAFAAWCLDQAGGKARESYQKIKPTSAASASWLKWGRPINLKVQPPIGAVVVMSPNSDTDEVSHVGFFREYVPGTSKAKVKILGGNQSNMVTHIDFSSSDIVSIHWIDPKFDSVDLGSETDPKFKDILDLIAREESGGNYNAHFGEADSQDPDFVNMAIANVRVWQDDFVRGGSRSSAVGRYQIIRKTMDGLIASMKLDKDQPFDANMQDRMAMKLMLGRGLKSFLTGAMSTTSFGNNLAKEWASFPVLSNIKGAHRQVARGTSFYSGDNLNHAHVDPAEVEAALAKLLQG